MDKSLRTRTERPLDLLNSLKGEKVDVVIRGRSESEETIVGTLLAFDIHINLVLVVDGKERFVRGDNVVHIEESVQY